MGYSSILIIFSKKGGGEEGYNTIDYIRTSKYLLVIEHLFEQIVELVVELLSQLAEFLFLPQEFLEPRVVIDLDQHFDQRVIGSHPLLSGEIHALDVDRVGFDLDDVVSKE